MPDSLEARAPVNTLRSSPTNLRYFGRQGQRNNFRPRRHNPIIPPVNPPYPHHTLEPPPPETDPIFLHNSLSRFPRTPIDCDHEPRPSASRPPTPPNLPIVPTFTSTPTPLADEPVGDTFAGFTMFFTPANMLPPDKSDHSLPPPCRFAPLPLPQPFPRPSRVHPSADTAATLRRAPDYLVELVCMLGINMLVVEMNLGVLFAWSWLDGELWS